MINLKLVLCFCTVFLMISSSAAAFIYSPNFFLHDFMKMEYMNYDGRVIYSSNEKHPNQVCATTLNETDAYWNFPDPGAICSANITCKVPRTDELIKLDVKPVTGVVCKPGYVCLNGACKYLKIHLGIKTTAKRMEDTSNLQPTKKDPEVELLRGPSPSSIQGCEYLKIYLEITTTKKVEDIPNSQPTTKDPPVAPLGWFLNSIYLDPFQVSSDHSFQAFLFRQ